MEDPHKDAEILLGLFVRLCYERYTKEGITPTDRAHSPIPDCLKGERIVLLTPEDHAKHDILQSLILDYPVFHASYLSHLEGTPWWEIAIEVFRERGHRHHKMGIGVHARTKEEMRKDGLKSAEVRKERGVGMFDPETAREWGFVQGTILYKEGRGIFGLDKLEMEKNRSKGGTAATSQRWISLSDGWISSPGGVACHNRGCGYDPAHRLKLTQEQYKVLINLDMEQRLNQIYD